MERVHTSVNHHPERKLYSSLHQEAPKECHMGLNEAAHVAFGRSVLEYSAVIYDPHLKKDTDKLEKLHRKTARFTISNYDRTSSVTLDLQIHTNLKLYSQMPLDTNTPFYPESSLSGIKCPVL